MLESRIQRYFIEQVEKRKLGIAVKVDCTSRRGWPDLDFMNSWGVGELVEVKSLKGVLSDHQIACHAEILEKCQYEVPVLSSNDEVDLYLDRIKYVNT